VNRLPLAAALALALLALAAACKAAGEAPPTASPTPSPAPTATLTPAPAVTAVGGSVQCVAADLSASAVLAPTGLGVLVGELEFVNRSREACSLEGYPEVELWGAAGRLEYVTAGRNVLPVSLVPLRPAEMAHSAFQFTEWCLKEDTSLPLSFVVRLPRAGGQLIAEISGDLSDRLISSPCDGIESPAPILHIGPFATAAPFPTETPRPLITP
jgi:hypothetical protein